jgi:membrane protease subunit (stomatin/prohibitin family)
VTGKALDTFGPGRHTITTANIPLLVNLVSAVFSGNTPFTAEAYFVSTRDFIDLRWGTPEPVTLRDQVLRMVRVRAHGTYSIQVADPQLFVARSWGARPVSTDDGPTIAGHGVIASPIVGQNTSPSGLPAIFEEISAATRVRVRDEFAAMGLALKQLYIVSVSPTRRQQGRRRCGLMGAIATWIAT